MQQCKQANEQWQQQQRQPIASVVASAIPRRVMVQPPQAVSSPTPSAAKHCPRTHPNQQRRRRCLQIPRQRHWNLRQSNASSCIRRHYQRKPSRPIPIFIATCCSCKTNNTSFLFRQPTHNNQPRFISGGMVKINRWR